LEQVAKKRSWEILLVMLLLAGNLQAKPEIMSLRMLSDETFNISALDSGGLFIDNGNRMFLEVSGREEYLLLNSNWVRTDDYGRFLNGFLKDDRLYLVFNKAFIEEEKSQFSICSVGKGITLEERIITEYKDFRCNISPHYGKVISVPGDNNAYYLFGYKTPLNFSTIISGGHGIHYEKPVLAEIHGQKVLKPEKVPYGGKKDESYHIKEILTGKDTIHFLGFRTQERFGAGNYCDQPPDPVVVHYAEYNTKNKKLVRSQDIYEKSLLTVKKDDDVILYRYGDVSADSFNNSISLVFSWMEEHLAENRNVKSHIYYSQCDGEQFSKPEKIGEGFNQLIRIDSFGNVHVIWINYNGILVHRAKKGDMWGEQQIISLGTDMYLTKNNFGNSMCAKFDKDNNLNVVFLSNGQLVRTKIKLD
jgi:hypothetical protein